MLNKQIAKLLGLTTQEYEVLKTLEMGPSNISSLSSLTGFPRTTLYTTLSTLKNRGLISTKTAGKAVLVSLTPSSNISKIFTQGATAFSPDGNIAMADFTLIHGKKAMLKVWQSLVNVKHERVYVIQPTKSLLNTIKLFKPGEFVPLNNAIKKNKVIMDTIMKEDGFPSYMAAYATRPDIQKKIIESFIGRSADMTKVDNRFLDNNAELLITSQHAFIMNWENQVGIKIENRDMINFLKELYILAKGYGKKIDFNEYMREWLKRT